MSCGSDRLQPARPRALQPPAYSDRLRGAAGGESLDEKLAAEEPDVSEDDIDEADAEPRAGRLVAPDAGGLFDEEKDEVAQDVGSAGYAASAEEAAVHVIPEE